MGPLPTNQQQRSSRTSTDRIHQTGLLGGSYIEGIISISDNLSTFPIPGITSQLRIVIIMKDRAARKIVSRRSLIVVFIAFCVILIFAYWNYSNVKKLRKRGESLGFAGATDRFEVLEHADPILLSEDQFSILHIDGERMKSVNTLYVIPGGGGSDYDGYPEWTKRRVVAAWKHYNTYHKSSNTAIFLALSAGSLNSPNKLYSDKRIMFECQHTVNHLLQLGIPKEIVFGDTFSWDTVTNGLVVRMAVEGIQEFRAMNEDNILPPTTTPVSSSAVAQASTDTSQPAVVATGTQQQPVVNLKPLNIEVFISDFHADRVGAAFDWILNLVPRVNSVQLKINTVSSVGIDWHTPLDYAQRISHEAEGTKRIKDNARSIKTLSQFYAFLMLGGHQGLHKYVLHDYVTSKGGGW